MDCGAEPGRNAVKAPTGEKTSPVHAGPRTNWRPGARLL